MNTTTEELGKELMDIRIDISGHNASQVIVSNFGASKNFCQLCGIDGPDLMDHFGTCSNEPGIEADKIFDCQQYLDHLRAREPQPVAPPIATEFIPGDHINNMEYILNLMAKERQRNGINY